MIDTTVVIAAAGRSERFFSSSNLLENNEHNRPAVSKVFLPLHGKPLWQYSVDRFRQNQRIGAIYLVIAANSFTEFVAAHDEYLNANDVVVVVGGHERWTSVQNAMVRIRADVAAGKAVQPQLIAVHDAARPCVQAESIAKVLDAAIQFGAAILAIPISGTVKRTDEANVIIETVSRTLLYQASTPQAFRYDWLSEVYSDEVLSTALRSGTITDDAQLIESAGRAVRVCEDLPSNIKVTTQADWTMVSNLLALPVNLTANS